MVHINGLPQLALRFIVALFRTSMASYRSLNAGGALIVWALLALVTLSSIIYGIIPDYFYLKHVRTQSIPSILPTNWTSVGCFTWVSSMPRDSKSVLNYFILYSDISTSRTLAAASFVQDPMTIEICINFCHNAGYIYAGVEFGRESSLIVYVLSINR